MNLQLVCAFALVASSICACGEIVKSDGQNDEGVQRQISTYMRKAMLDSHTPGVSFAVVKDGSVIQEGAFGLANVETGTVATPETVYKVASLSKSFLAAATLMLIHDKKLQLGTKACEYLERCPDAWKKITVYQLLTHTSGLVRDPADYEPYRERPISAVIESAYPIPLHAAPGTQWLYSNLGYFVLAEIITKVSGMSWDRFIAEKILSPAGIRSTWLNSPLPIIPHRANGYQWRDGELVNAENWIANRPSSAFVSDLGDLAKWESFLDQRGSLDPENWNQMWNVGRLSDGSVTRYGFGWYVDRYLGETRIHHDGEYPGFRSEMDRFPEDRLSVIILANCDSFPAEQAAVMLAGFFDKKLKSPTFTVQAESPAAAIPMGSPLELKVDVTDEANAAPDTLVEIEIRDASGETVHKDHIEGLNFNLAERRTETFRWTPDKAGEFTLNVGVYGARWIPGFAWKERAAVLHVVNAKTDQAR